MIDMAFLSSAVARPLEIAAHLRQSVWNAW
jgi:hypothetical protein